MIQFPVYTANSNKVVGISLPSIIRAILLVLIASVTTSTPSTGTSSATTTETCGVYLAESTIPGAGLGMFAGQRYELWDPVGPPDIVIPVNDYGLHHPELGYETIFDYYGWKLHSFRHMAVEGVESSVGFAPGAGAALNCLLPLANVIGMDNYVQMNTDLHRSKDPGAGASTPFTNRQIVAKGTIEAGHELFDWYGEAYFLEREYMYGKIPMLADYERADALLRDFLDLLEKMCGYGVCMNASSEDDDDNDDSNGALQAAYRHLVELMAGRLSSIWTSRTLNALPNDPNVVKTVAETGTAFRDYNRSARSLEWLQEYGACMDHMEIGKSQIDEQAGNGAFATQFLAKGSLVAPAPVLHMRKSLLEMFPVRMNEVGGLEVSTDEERNHYQLILNYCFGHPQLSFVLCPYGAVTGLINHSKEQANVKLEWNYKLMQHPDWLVQEPDAWVDKLHSGLAMSYVATRDINPGEEVLFDYGAEWEAAWKRHVSMWKPPPDANAYTPAVELNERDIIPTIFEQQAHNDDFVNLICRTIYVRWSGLPTAYDDEQPGTKHEDGVDTVWTDQVYCRPVARFQVNGETMYTAELFSRDQSEGMTIDHMYNVLLMVPRDALAYEDRPYSRE